MWTFTKHGFYSTVAHRQDEDCVIVRTRSKQDAKNLLGALDDYELCRAGETPTIDRDDKADYPFRVHLRRVTWAEYLARTAEEISYDNFKSMVDREFGHKRHDVYTDIWWALGGYGAVMVP